MTNRHSHNSYVHAAEIAARHAEDVHSTSIDRVLCDPSMRKCFDDLATRLAPDVCPYLLRKAALGLRKQRKLKPELVSRMSERHTKVEKYAAEDLLRNPSLIPQQPGVYIFSDNTGYLYIGQAIDLSTRVRKHLDHSDRKAVARYFWEHGMDNLQVELHSFDKDSDGKWKRYRTAYEASLIASRQPRFNIRM